ncbi:MAG TPA: GNAT family N-acetyltransferase [Herpetosiphonaceae bacterium]
MQLQDGIFPVTPEDFPRVVDVWESSVRATHDFLTEADIQFYKPFVQSGLPHVEHLLCMRDSEGQVVGFIGVVKVKIEMLFIDPAWRGQGIGRRLLTHAVEVLGATLVDVNEQNPQAIGFYDRMGFEVIWRSERDGADKPFPILHLRLRGAAPPTGD